MLATPQLWLRPASLRMTCEFLSCRGCYCVRHRSFKLTIHSTPGGGGYGQNIAMYASTDASSLTEETVVAQAITEMWYNGELDLYPSNAYGQANPDFTNFEQWGHYSQIVWVGSTQVGCAAQYCAPGTMNPSMGAWYSVCNYYPAGMLSTSLHSFDKETNKRQET